MELKKMKERKRRKNRTKPACYATVHDCTQVSFHHIPSILRVPRRAEHKSLSSQGMPNGSSHGDTARANKSLLRIRMLVRKNEGKEQYGKKRNTHVRICNRTTKPHPALVSQMPISFCRLKVVSSAFTIILISSDCAGDRAVSLVEG